MSGIYRVLVSDCPWKFGDDLPGKSRGASKNYETMNVEELRGYLTAFGDPCAKDALLFFWRVSSMVEEAYSVVRAWGFVPKSEIVWRKMTKGNVVEHFGMGRYVRASHETCIVAARGRAIPLIRNHSTRSVFSAPVPVNEDGKHVHSAKPDEFYRIIENLTDGPRLELFARKRRLGFDSRGLELETDVA